MGAGWWWVKAGNGMSVIVSTIKIKLKKETDYRFWGLHMDSSVSVGIKFLRTI